MAISQNLRFSASPLSDNEFEHPPGASIAKLLKFSLSERGLKVSEIDNWRDCGWSITCSDRSLRLDVVVAKTAVESEWFLQIAPTYQPGLFGWLFGKKPSASPGEIFKVAMDVHLILSRQKGFTDFKWIWNSYPEDNASTSEPVAANDTTN